MLTWKWLLGVKKRCHFVNFWAYFIVVSSFTKKKISTIFHQKSQATNMYPSIRAVLFLTFLDQIFSPVSTGYILLSMTSLLAHTVAQPTKWRFLPKNLNQLVIFVIGLTFTWSRVDKNRARFQKKKNTSKNKVIAKWFYYKLFH